MDHNDNAIAVIGMAGRFPGAPNVDVFYENLCKGIEGISFFDEGTMLAAGIDVDTLRRPDFVSAKPGIPNIDQFDAGYFGINPSETIQMDPQHRIFLECCVTALNDANIDPARTNASIGLFGGCGVSTYWNQVNAAAVSSGLWSATAQAAFGNIQDYLCTRVAYKLNLKGPAYTVQSACSASLLAIHLACQHLINFECDVALAGGITVTVPEVSGYFYQEDGIVSPDGHCRPFDARAAGTIFGSGAGVVVLKRLEDAIADGDIIDAVVLGSAINNDGSVKAAYSAPSVSGQARVITEALAAAEVSADTIRYVEAHGTATPIGDPIEVSALTRAYRLQTQETGYCALGSVKSNVGHLDTAAGVTGFIKTVLSVKHGKLFPTLHFQEPNPKIDFANSPFFVSNKLLDWPTHSHPRRAANSSFGVGGTNVHAIIEAAPRRPEPTPTEDRAYVVTASAKDFDALDESLANLADYLDAHSDTQVSALAHSLSQGRPIFQERFAAIIQNNDLENLIATLDEEEGTESFTATAPAMEPRAVFLFPGQGAQYLNMGRGLYDTEPVFREYFDDCRNRLQTHIGSDIRSIIFVENASPEAESTLTSTRWTQPALFIISYSLARTLMTWGIHPGAMIGHSVGEYVAACISGVMSLDDALLLVSERGALTAELPSGSMLAVHAPAEQIKAKLQGDLSLALVNSPRSCVIAGTEEAIGDFQQTLQAEDFRCRVLDTSHAFHSHMMEPMQAAFKRVLERCSLNTPQIPFISNLTGTWIRDEEATSVDYWLRQVRRTVLFSDGLSELLREENQILFEVGPGQTLASLCRQQEATQIPRIIQLLPDSRSSTSARDLMLKGLAQAWVSGAPVLWNALQSSEGASSLRLPAYPFQRHKYWIDAPETPDAGVSAPNAVPHKRSNVGDWFYLPSSKQIPVIKTRKLNNSVVLLGDEVEEVAKTLSSSGAVVNLNDFTGVKETTVVDLRPLEQSDKDGLEAIIQTVQSHADAIAEIILVCPQKSALIDGPLKVISQEFPTIRTSRLNYDKSDRDQPSLVEAIYTTLTIDPQPEVSFTNGALTIPDFFQTRPPLDAIKIVQGETILVTGGLGGVSLALAEAISELQPKVHLVLASRSGMVLKATAQEVIERLESRGTQVSIEALDINNAAAVSALIAKLENLSGVIHAAGIPGGKIIARHEPGSCDPVLAPKVEGTRNLLAALEGRDLKFCVLCSSLAAMTGGVGQTDYTAANAYLDVTARSHDGDRRRIISLNWDAWRNLGMTQSEGTSELRDQIAIKREEGKEAFKLALRFDQPQIIISTIDLASRLKPTVTKDAAYADKDQSARQRHPRPAFNVDFVTPNTPTEAYFAEVFADILAIDRVGTRDNFFELGGDSLSALELTAKLKSDKGWSLSITQLYQSPTIAALSKISFS
ncbi:MAG: acyltransferase domain-containing protein [Opitutales bacterium]|nr:acyltransferase domain-containing protein [Opitutales bacterium]